MRAQAANGYNRGVGRAGVRPFLTMEQHHMRFSWHVGLGRELGYVFWAKILFEAAYGAYSTIWPLWIAHLSGSITIVGIVLGLAGIVRPFILLGGSWASDRLDNRMMLIVVRSALVLSLVFAAFAGSWQLLLPVVFFYGFGELVYPILHAHIPVHAGDDVARAFSLTSTIGPSVALIVTPLLTSVVVALFGLQGGILLSAAFSATGILFMWRMDFSQDREYARSTTPATLRELMRHAPSRDIVLLHGITIFALGLGAMLLPNYLAERRGLSPSLITLLAGGAAIGTTLFGVASLRVGWVKRAPFLAAALSTVVASTGFLLLALSGALPVIVVAFVLRGGMFATWTFLLTAIGQNAPPRLQTRAFALVEVLGGGALSFAPVVAAELYGVSPELPLLAAFAFGTLMSIVLVLRFKRGFTVVERPVVQVATPVP